MQTPIRPTFRAVQQFLSNGSNVVSLLVVVGLFVVIVALLPLGSLLQAPASDTAHVTAPSVSVMRQEALKDQWIESRNATIALLPFSRERQDDLKEQWLARDGMTAHEATADAASDPFDVLKEKLMVEHGMIGPAVVNMQQRQEELKDQWLERRLR